VKTAVTGRFAAVGQGSQAAAELSEEWQLLRDAGAGSPGGRRLGPDRPELLDVELVRLDVCEKKFGRKPYHYFALCVKCLLSFSRPKTEQIIPSQIAQIGSFGLKIDHLATLVEKAI
jgi:hypothetical protein